MQISSTFAHLPGMGTVVETFEAAYSWGPYPRYYTGGYISANATDSGNTPNSTLRMGLVMGIITATGQWTNYAASNTDGSEVARGVLPLALRMQDVLTETNVAKFYAIMVSGGVQASKLIGLDNLARAQMAKQFIFDDNLWGNTALPWQHFQTKTASYQVLASDNLTLFDNAGATGAVTFTLPPIANGYAFSFRVLANQNVLVTSTEGGNLVALNNASGNTVSFQTGGQLIGGGFDIFSNAAGTKWYVENVSAGTNTVTVA